MGIPAFKSVFLDVFPFCWPKIHLKTTHYQNAYQWRLYAVTFFCMGYFLQLFTGNSASYYTLKRHKRTCKDYQLTSQILAHSLTSDWRKLILGTGIVGWAKKLLSSLTKVNLNCSSNSLQVNTFYCGIKNYRIVECVHASEGLKWGKRSGQLQGCNLNALIQSFEMSPHLIVRRLHSQTLLWPASGSGLKGSSRQQGVRQEVCQDPIV